jgi:myo-inositol-1(or 4)-monophosphatase
MTDIQRLLDDAVEREVFSGAQAGIQRGLAPPQLLVAGSTCLPAYAEPVAVVDATLFDLASLTKFVSTAPLLWYALGAGVCGVDDAVGRWLPEWSHGSEVTLRMLANHTSGLPAWAAFFASCSSPESVVAAVMRTAMEAVPGERHAYSDLGYILLGVALERMLGDSLDVLFRDVVADPLGMSSTGFAPRGGALAGCAHTEASYAVGRVHDENAAALGGVAGHAGLFGTAQDLLRFAAAILASDGGPPPPWDIAPSVVRWALSAATQGVGSHLLGADTPSGPASNAGQRMARHPVGATVGHLGFTGTSIWIDRTRALATVLLTNRVHPSRDEEGIGQVRRAFSDACVAAPESRRLWPPGPALIGPTRRSRHRSLRHREVACAAARAAGMLAMRLASAGVAIEHKGTVDLVTEADVAAEKLIIAALGDAFPEHGVLAEESGAGGQDSSHVWIIDPIDGTTNFSHGFPHFCVCIALEVDGQLELGVTYDPSRDEMFWAGRGQGAWCNGRRISVSRRDRLERSLAVTGFPYDRGTNPDNNADYFADMLRRTRGMRRVGSAGLDLAWVAAGRVDVYFELRLKPWDCSAGVVLVEEAGGRVTDYDGLPFRRSVGDVVATCGGGVHEEVIAALSTLRPRSDTPTA